MFRRSAKPVVVVLVLFGSLLSATPADTQVPPAGGGSPEEITSLRTRDAKFFRNPDGTYTALFGHYLHYQTEPGRWEDVDLTFRSIGQDHIMDRHDIVVRVRGASVEALERSSGRGIQWLTPVRPAVAGRRARFPDQGLTWEYATRKSGIKLAAMVTAPRGPKTYEFRYRLVGGAADLTLDGEGNLVGDAFTVPRAVAIGADRESYPAGAWRLLPGPRVAFEFDDSALPPEAFPYELDPTTTFNVAASDDDGWVYGWGASYPPAPTSVSQTWSQDAERQFYPGQGYGIGVVLMRWDTSPLPDNVSVTGATLRVALLSKANNDNRNLTADWYSNWPIDLADHSTDAQTSALGGKPLAQITGFVGGQDWDIPLDNANGVSASGYTGLRLHVSGGQPTSTNYLSMASYEHTSYPEPRLLVTFMLTGPLITSAEDSPDPVTAGGTITFRIGWIDPDLGDSVRAVICRTKAVDRGTCPGGDWAIGSLSSTSPSTASYPTTAGDAGTRTYYAFACDAGNGCSGPLSGTFTVQSPPPGPVSRVQAASTALGTSGSSLSVSWPAPTAAGNLLLLAVTARWTGGIGTITPPAGWTLAKLVDHLAAPQGWRLSTALYYRENAPSQSGAVAVTTSALADEILVAIAEYRGIASSGSLDQHASNTGNSTTPDSGTTATTSQANELWIGVLGNDAAADQGSPTNGFAQVNRPQTGAGAQGLYEKVVSVTGQANVSARLSFDMYWTGAVATFKAAGTPGNLPPTISSVSDDPDPVEIGVDVEFAVSWQDPGDSVRAVICKTNAIVAASCPGGAWAIGGLTSASVANTWYRTTSADVGIRDYFAFACDSGNLCSTSMPGSFTVLADPAPPPDPDEWEAAGSPWSGRGLQDDGMVQPMDALRARPDSGADDGLAAEGLSTPPPPPATNSWYIRYRADWYPDDAEARKREFRRLGRRQPHGFLVAILDFGAVCSERGLTVHSFGEACVDVNQIARAVRWWYYGFVRNGDHAGSFSVTLVIGTNNSGSGDPDINRNNARNLYDALATILYPYVSRLNEREGEDRDINLYVAGGSDIETQGGAEGWKGPDATIPWVRGWNAKVDNKNDRVPTLFMLNYGNYFPQSLCTTKSCWDQPWTNGGWTPHQVWNVSWGGSDEDFNADFAFPQMYVHHDDDTNTTGWGEYWRSLNRAARDAGVSRIDFMGVLWTCNVGNMNNPEQAHRNFTKETGQRTPFLSFIHALDRSC